MNPLLADAAEFSALLQRFFAERLIQQKNVSPRTVTAYRNTFRLLLRYIERVRGTPPAKLTLNDFDATLVLDFLAHLEAERHNSVRSRNARLAAVRAFAVVDVFEAGQVTQPGLAQAAAQALVVALGQLAADQQSAPSKAPPDPSRSGTTLSGLLALTGALGVDEAHLLHRATRATGSAYFTRFGKSSSEFPCGAYRLINPCLSACNKATRRDVTPNLRFTLLI